MVGLRLVHLIENHSEELVANLVVKIERSSRTKDLKKVPPEELRARLFEILHHLSEWLLTKTDHEIQERYIEVGSRRAAQGVSQADFCWALVLTKEHLWEFLSRNVFTFSPVELYGEMELMRLLDQFFDRALSYAMEGYQRAQVSVLHTSAAHAAD